jgi:hypothetical protein
MNTVLTEPGHTVYVCDSFMYIIHYLSMHIKRFHSFQTAGQVLSVITNFVSVLTFVFLV